MRELQRVALVHETENSWTAHAFLLSLFIGSGLNFLFFVVGPDPYKDKEERLSGQDRRSPFHGMAAELNFLTFPDIRT